MKLYLDLMYVTYATLYSVKLQRGWRGGNSITPEQITTEAVIIIGLTCLV